jgi:NitT/TauT family transport system substrate-binding protein
VPTSRIDQRASPRPTRRALLTGLASIGVASAAGRLAAGPVEGLEILGAPTGASISLARTVDAGLLAAAAPNATFRLWHDPDELRAGIVSGRTRLFSTPTHLPANLANRGLPITLLCLLGQGHLYVVTANESINAFKNLAGQPVLCFFRNDMPDLVFRACARIEGIDPDKDIKLTYVQTGMEAAQLLAAGKAESALLSEPAATAAIMMAAREGRSLRRSVSLQEVWAAHHGGVGIPMVGVAVQQSLIDEDPGIVAALAASLPAAKSWVLANRAEAAALAEKDMAMRPQVFEKAIDYFNMEIVSAHDAKRQLETFYQAILDLAPDALGGKLPADDFYLRL